MHVKNNYRYSKAQSRDSCYGIKMKLFHVADMYLKYFEFIQYIIQDMNIKYFRSFTYSIAVPRPPADIW